MAGNNQKFKATVKVTHQTEITLKNKPVRKEFDNPYRTSNYSSTRNFTKKDIARQASKDALNKKYERRPDRNNIEEIKDNSINRSNDNTSSVLNTFLNKRKSPYRDSGNVEDVNKKSIPEEEKVNKDKQEDKNKEQVNSEKTQENNNSSSSKPSDLQPKNELENPEKKGVKERLGDLKNNLLNRNKNNAKKAAKAEVKKKALTFLMKNPYVLLFISALGIILLVLLIVIGGGSINGTAYGAEYAYGYEACNTITVKDPSTGSTQVLDFEKYIAGVVTAENGHSGYEESGKSQAILARTFAIRETNNCTTTIVNGQSKQVYKEPSEFGIRMAKETEGMIMTDEEGNLVSAFFASYPSAGYNGFPAFPACDSIKCDSTTCTTTIYKMSSKNKYKEMSFTMNRTDANGNYWNGADLTKQSGHCYGYSQLGARYLDSIGKDYKQILDTFFFDYKIVTITEQSENGNGLVLASGASFSTRTTKPTSNIKVYSSANNNGAIKNTPYSTEYNKFAHYGYVGQCTWYAHGRAKEILNELYTKNKITEEGKNKAYNILDNLSGSAATWWDTNKNLKNHFAYGQTPKPGAIVVWHKGSGACSGYTYPNAGHVGIVESVVGDPNNYTGIYISDGYTNKNNLWDYAVFSYRYMSKETVKSYNGDCRRLSGFIYLLD